MTKQPIQRQVMQSGYYHVPLVHAEITITDGIPVYAILPNGAQIKVESKDIFDQRKIVYAIRREDMPKLQEYE